MFVRTLRDFYERGYWDAIQFGYIPDFSNKQEKDAYWNGYKDSKDKKGMSETAYL